MAAQYPTAVVTDPNLGIAVNRAQSTLSAALNSSDVACFITSGAQFLVNTRITIDSEIIRISASAGNNPTIERGVEGTSPAAHLIGALVSNYITANYHTQLADEVKAIETSLGVNLKRVATGEVTIIQDGSGWIVRKPDQTLLTIAGSTTQGLQEAITYAVENGFHICGRGGTAITGASSVINCTTAIVWPAMQNIKVRLHGLTINFTSALGSATAMSFDSMLMCNVDMGGTQIVNAGAGITLLFKPVNPCAVDGSSVISASTVHITTVVNIHATPSAVAAVPLIQFDISALPILDTTFIFDEVNASGSGFTVTDPGGSGVFRGNYIRSANVHHQTGTTLPVVQIGVTSAAGSTNIIENVWDLVSVQINTAAKLGISTWGSWDQFRVNVFQVTISAGVAFTFQSTADFNQLFAGRLNGAAGVATLVDLSVTGTQNNNAVHCQHIKNNLSITVGASPFVHQNTDFVPQLVTCNAGTVTDISFSHDNITYSSTQSTGNIVFTLDPGMYVKVTYSSAPTMRKIL